MPFLPKRSSSRHPPSTIVLGILFFCAAVLVLSACGEATPELLKRQDLFSLKLGRMENGIDMFQIGGVKSASKNRVFMRNGIFYIANGNSGKIMEFSSYGDLIGLFYNPQENPKPVLMGDDAGQGRISNKQAVSYSFQQIGEIAVSRTGNLLVDDLSPEAQRVFDEKIGAELNHVVLRFDEKGRYLDYIGQEGLGGSPFPYIEGLYVTINDDIVVVSRTTKRSLVYWYDASGKRKFLVDITDDTLPIPNEGRFVPSLKAIRPDPEYAILSLHIDYYPVANIEASQQTELPRVESRVYSLNVPSGVYNGWFSLPYETVPLKEASQFEPKRVQALHNFLGTGVGGRYYFTHRAGDDRHVLTIVERNGRVQQKRLLEIDDSSLVDVDYHLSFEGVISGFYGFEDHALIAWWRADGSTPGVAASPD